jgi:hypothetical protein
VRVGWLSGDQIHHAMDLLGFTMSRQWQAAVQVALPDPCIPPYKVGHMSCDLGEVDHTWVSVIATQIAVALSWGEPKIATARSTRSSINKVCVSGFLWL